MRDSQQFSEVKDTLGKICSRRNVPPDNDVLNDLAEALIVMSEQRSEDPIVGADALSELLRDEEDLGTRWAIRVFMWYVSGGKYSGV